MGLLRLISLLPLQLSEISDIPLENLEFAKVCEMHYLIQGTYISSHVALVSHLLNYSTFD